MLLGSQNYAMIIKLMNVTRTYEAMIFNHQQELECTLLETKEHWRKPPVPSQTPISKGAVWGGEYITGWIQTTFKVDEMLEGKKLYLIGDTGARETLLFVNNQPKGMYANKIVINNFGNHYAQCFSQDAKLDEVFEFALEAYCWHNVPGNQPFAIPETGDRKVTFGGVYVAVMDEAIKDFVFDLRTVCELAEHTQDVFWANQINKSLVEAYKYIAQNPTDVPEDVWREGMAKAQGILKQVLAYKNTQDVVPEHAIIGHSHLDTAWQWTVEETIRKSARTYSNVLNLMEQYPEYMFMQSASYHGELMRRHYPEIFAGIVDRIKEGRYEPNGGAYVECDCLLTSGESIIRQFLWGQRFTEKHYDYRSDTFWLPDSFGFTAALPQILQGCGIKYFLTTKLGWNDTNMFPYTSFHWKGIDGSTVLTHFDNIHTTPSPKGLVERTYGTTRYNPIKENMMADKTMNLTSFSPFGFGDGGGGPSYDMIELAQRSQNLQGCPKTSYTTMSAYMQSLEDTVLPTYKDELYLETHRGTLTSISKVKKANRQAEVALHNLDLAMAWQWMDGKALPDITQQTEQMLVNQFHDILPGTSLAPINDSATQQFIAVKEAFDSLFDTLLKEDHRSKDQVTLVNTTSWERSSCVIPEACGPIGENTQFFEDVAGNGFYYVEGISIPSLGSCSVKKEKEVTNSGENVFSYGDGVLDTPFYTIRMNEQGSLTSIYAKHYKREIIPNGQEGNVLMLAEDIPSQWDNWNIDQDVLENLQRGTQLVSSEVVTEGPLMLRVRNSYILGNYSKMQQDMMVYANKEEIEFDTQISWQEKHKLLKAMFNFDVNVGYSKHEVQFGYAERPTHKNNKYDGAKFEVSNYRYSDFSEGRFGVALLNDCKYGLSVDENKVGLTLIKGGTHPDQRGDAGEHRLRYVLKPHSGFNVENVVRPAYELNVPIGIIDECACEKVPFIHIADSNILVETVKVAEDQDSIIIRLYEAEGSGCTTTLTLDRTYQLIETNMIEEEQQAMGIVQSIDVPFRAFEVKTFKVKRI